MVPSVTLFVAPAAKLMRVAVGRFEVVGAAGNGAEVDVEVGSEGRIVGKGVEVTCVGLARGVDACKV